jgi:uncharacterized protein YjbI with pentapeptide repeats
VYNDIRAKQEECPVSEQEPATNATATQEQPVPAGYATWNEYWTGKYNQPWRSGPEIAEERKQYLAERRALKPDIQKGIYPFRDESGSITLTRADVEWLLATHESGGMYGPVEWSDLHQRHRQGLDLRGARFESLENLSRLPLAGLRGAFESHSVSDLLVPKKAQEAAAVHLDGVILDMAHVEGASLDDAHLRGAMIGSSEFRESSLNRIHLEGAILQRTGLEMCSLVEAQLTGAQFDMVHCERAIMRQANLAGATFQRTFFDAGTVLDGIILRDDTKGEASFLDMRWRDANLAVVDWAQMRTLRFPSSAVRAATSPHAGAPRHGKSGLEAEELEGAVRANRQLSAALREQGLNEHADRFVYSSQKLKREVLRRRRRFGAALGSLFLDLISGYGYRPGQSIFAYMLLVGGFAVAYYLLGPSAGHAFAPDGALIFSVTSFHGRGFFPGDLSPENWITRLAAIEAVLGLLLEIAFIATFTQRFFAR